jgi:hypothetical protein
VPPVGRQSAKRLRDHKNELTVAGLLMEGARGARIRPDRSPLRRRETHRLTFRTILLQVKHEARTAAKLAVRVVPIQLRMFRRNQQLL